MGLTTQGGGISETHPTRLLETPETQKCPIPMGGGGGREAHPPTHTDPPKSKKGQNLSAGTNPTPLGVGHPPTQKFRNTPPHP